MPRYSYTAKNFSGEIKKGVLEAQSEHDLANAVRQDGYLLISCSLENILSAKSKTDLLAFLPFLNKISLAEKLMFSRNLLVMVKAGISLPRAIKILSNQTKNNKFKKILSEISDEITKGENLSTCLEKRPDVFSHLFCSMIKVGEESGTMEDVLKVLIVQMEKDYELKSRVKGALVYPAVILVAMIGIGILMLIMVVPKLAQTFAELNIPLPVTTQFVVALGNLMGTYWYLIPFVVLAFYVSFKVLKKNDFGKKTIDGTLLKLPLVSPLIKKANTAYTVRTLSSLISAGVPIVKSMELVADSLENSYYQSAFKIASEEVKKGLKLADALAKHKNIYAPLMIEMLEIGEETGETSAILGKLAEFFEEEVSNMTRNLSSIVEPLLMIVIGVAVGFFAVSMLQPMYSMMNSLK